MIEILRKAVQADGRSIYQLARDADVVYPILYRFMRGDKTGRKQSLNIITADRLAVALGLELTPKSRARKKR